VTAGFHSPLPPARSGVADYAAALLAALREYGTVQVGARRADVHLYHLGNNQLHREIYRRAIEEPGVAVLHDAVLQHFFLGWLDRSAYIEEFVYNYGPWSRGVAGEMWNERARSGGERHFRYPMLRRIAERSLAVVVHNPGAARTVLAHAPKARVREIPHLFVPPAEADPVEVIRLRERWGGDFVFAVMGYLRESKRLPAVLRAMDVVRRRRPGARLLLAGEFVSADLERQLRPHLRRDDVVYQGWSTEREFWMQGAAADACVNLRHPSAGETSGIGIKMMGLGKPVIYTESEEVSRFPDGSCIRIAHGVAEVEELAEHMTLLAGHPALARRIGGRAAEHIRRVHAARATAGLYWDLLRSCGAGRLACYDGQEVVAP